MELHQLRYVLAVGKTGNFSRAAEACHVSQPSLSQQIQKLEQEMGERLFTRLKREAVPTAAGRALLTRAARILGEVDAAMRDVEQASGEVRGVVTLGVLPTIAPYLLPKVLAACRKLHPKIDVIVHENTTSQLLAMTGSCEVELSVLSLPIRDERFQHEHLFWEELLLAVPPRHPLAQRKRGVKLEDVEVERFILLQEGHCLGDQVLRFCDRERCRPSVVFRTAQLETIQSLVASGLGVSLIPQMACGQNRKGQPVYLSLGEPQPKRAIGMLWRKEYSPTRAVAALMEVIRESVAE